MAKKKITEEVEEFRKRYDKEKAQKANRYLWALIILAVFIILIIGIWILITPKSQQDNSGVYITKQLPPQEFSQNGSLSVPGNDTSTSSDLFSGNGNINSILTIALVLGGIMIIWKAISHSGGYNI